jgi:hypothetical protein
LAAIRHAGFNVVSGNFRDPAINAILHEFGLRYLTTPGTTAGFHFSTNAANAAVRDLDGDPALWAWYLVDDPDMNRVPPLLVEEANKHVKSRGARKPTAIVLQDGAAAVDYGSLTDILLIDRYPVPWQPLATFGQHVRMARLGAGPKKPLIAVIQAFDWSLYPELLPGEKNLRPPTRDELRCMTYQALVERANGLFYYTFDDRRWRLPEHPETWDALQAVIFEVRDREPLFRADHLWWPWRHNVKYRSPDRVNATWDSSVTFDWVWVETGNWAVPRGHYVVGVNTTEQAQNLRFYLPVSVKGAVPVLGEERNAEVAENWLRDDYAPYGVHVYGPLR